MPTRRDALRALAAAAAGSVLSPDALPALSPRDAQQRRLARIGIQLYTLRNEMKGSVERTLGRVAGVGYTEVEFAGYFGTPPKALRAMLDGDGLRAPAAHVELADMRTNPGKILDAAAILGHQWVIVAWFSPNERRTLDDWKRRAEEFSRLGALAKERGVRFAYHNHDFEFTPLGGETGYDVLLAGTDPAAVDFELDLFWVTKAGHDPIAYLRKANGRIPMVHVKDMDASPERRMVDVGAGTIPFARIFAEGERLGLRHFFVEHDEPADPLASASASYRYLAALRY